MERDLDYHFKVIIEECDEGGYFADCPSFQGCHAEGITYEETLAEIKNVITGFIEEYLENDLPVPFDNFTIASVRIAV